MPESLSRQMPWLRILVEGVVIVASVLLALAADAWWDGRQQLQDEFTALRGLEADLQATLDEIAVSRQVYETRAKAAERLIALTGDQTPNVSAATVDTLLARSILGTYFEPVDATLATLLSSGQLALISNVELRSALAGWPPRLASIRRLEEEYSRQTLGHLLPYLYERVPVRALDAINLSEAGVRPSGFQRDSRALLTDLFFENGVNDLLFYSRLLAGRMGALEEYAEQTLGLITTSLESR
jgi:hypothetical protein